MEMESYEMRARFIARTICRLKQVWKVTINTAVSIIMEMCTRMWILKQKKKKGEESSLVSFVSSDNILPRITIIIINN
jgi:hypothetical protein